MISTIEAFQQIYPSHVLIKFKLTDRDQTTPVTSLDRVNLNQLCIEPIKQWMIEAIGLEVNSAFPCLLSGSDNFGLISKLVNGFVLQVGESRIVFVPSTTVDISEMEIPQEWVDLPNWAANYYVSVRVDLEQQYLHLWGFISHTDLKAKAELDPVFNNYHVDGLDTISDLRLLQDKCMAVAPVSSITVNPIDRLSSSHINKLIQQLQAHQSPFSPRLELSFTEWGVILNEPQRLDYYLNPAINPLVWLKSTKLAICHGWESIEHWLNPPQAIPAMSRASKLPTILRVKEVRLGSAAEIELAIAQLYHEQTDLPVPTQITGIEDLVPLLKHCKTEKTWWKAAEYLWTIQPDFLPSVSRIKRLETQFSGHSIALTFAMIPTLDDHLAILVRLYSANQETHLPPGLQLTIQNDLGVNLLTNPAGDPYIATARADVKDSYIQLYFVAELDDRFNACITLNEVRTTKSFNLQQHHPS